MAARGTNTKTTNNGGRSKSAGAAKKSAGTASARTRTASKAPAGKSQTKASSARKTPAGRGRSKTPGEEPDGMRNEIVLMAVLVLSVLLLLSNFNLCGSFGNIVSKAMYGLFGLPAALFPIVLFLGTAFVLSNKGSRRASRKTFGAVALWIAITALIQLFAKGFDSGMKILDYYNFSAENKTGGGLVGGAVCKLLCPLFGTVGAFVILFALIVVCVMLLTGKALFAYISRKSEESIRRRKEERLREQEYEDEFGEYDDYEGYEDPVYETAGAVSGRGEKPRRPARTVKLKRAGEDAKSEPSGERAGSHMDGAVRTERSGRGQNGQNGKNGRKGEFDVTELHPASIPVSGAYIPSDELIQDVNEIYEEELRQKFRNKKDEIDVSDSSVGDVLRGTSGKRSKSGKTVFSTEADNSFDNSSTLSSGFEPQPDGADSALLWEDEIASGITSAGTEGTLPVQNRTSQIPPVISEKDGADAENHSETGSGDSQGPAFGYEQKLPEETVAFPNPDGLVSGSAGERGNAGEKPHSSRPASASAPGSRSGGESGAGAAGASGVTQDGGMGMDTITPIEEPKKEYVFPPVDLLSKPKPNAKGMTEFELKETAVKLQKTLESFGVRVTITNISCGPAVTRYELQPEQGVKVSKITGLADDIKLNLAAADVRIEAPIPGKAAVGIEVPNKENTAVMLRELIDSNAFKKHPSDIAFAVGKDIGGQTVVTDIGKMPHLLIAGATGSGKSVCINTLIMSILYKAKPSDVRLIMVDPKVVELSVYNGIPHLLIPVVTDPKKASAALNWAVMEMTDRYQKFAELGVRDLKGYNEKVSEIEPLKDDKYPKLPQIVIIVDELADLMMVAPGEVEDAICRLAQMARAAGLHLIIATQRPSVNVITGLIKANVPSRIAFSVSSAIDSRTIIDGSGAEKLLGKGDMLFFPSGYPKPVRVQGAFVSDKEVSAVVDFLKNENQDAAYSNDVSEKIANAGVPEGASGGASDRDDYFIEAGKFIIEKDKASIGMLQRVYKIGFNRAARIMDQLAEAGVVGPEEGTKPRKILMSQEEFEEYVDEYV